MNLNELKRFDTHSHSEFSNLRLIDSINKIPDMIKTAHKLGMAGIALTDHETLSGHLRWLQEEKKLKEKGTIPEDFKCALGNEIYLVDDRTNVTRYWHYILIAKNADGHKALRELSSIAWYNGFAGRGQMRVPTEKRELEQIVKKYPNSLVATTACIGGELGGMILKIRELSKAGQMENAFEIEGIEGKIKDFIDWNINLFGDDFYIEIAAGTSKEQIYFNNYIKKMAWGKARFVIGSDAHYLTANERPVHKAYLNSKDGEREVDAFYFDAHMMDNEEAFENLSKSNYSEEDFIEICSNTMTIYDKIESFSLTRNSIIPEINVKDYPIGNFKGYEKYPIINALLNSADKQERYWVNDCLISMKEKELEDETYLSRLETEADIIKFVGDKLNDCLFKYFNTYQHYIDLFWDCGSIVGPGRGSSVCFLSNYLMGITQLDPIVWGLKEWRFLNKERVELPDIDTDICPSKRQRIFKAIRDERTETNVLQVCTFGTEGSRSAVAAAGRGYRSPEYPDGLDVETTQYLSGLIPQERGFLWSIHDVVYGDEEKDRKPITAFVNEVNKYPGLLDIIENIEGLVNKRGQHASGVIMYNESPIDTNAIMRSPNGDITTQMSLHDAEAMGDVKYDMLVTEISDKIAICLSLLRDDGYIPSDMNLREIYDSYLHPSKIDVNDKRLWEALGNGEILDVFQFSTGVGLATAKQVKPQTPMELTSANALMRLMGEKGKERPLDRYCRLKDDIELWYDECRDRGLSEEEIKVLEPYYLPNYGVPASQEDLMEVCMDPNIGHFTLGEANAARKIVAKKQMDKIGELKEKFVTQCPNENFGEYVWETTMGPQMGYAFAKPHALAYSFVGIQTLILATHFPSIFWNCACLIIKAGGAELLEADDVNDDEEEDEKKKNKSVNYGKISIAIGESKNAGINVLPPDMNKSKLIFTPDVENNAIIYGLKGINRIGTQLVYDIIKNRPYSSIEDFLSKVKVNKTQMINLIKAGTFDSLYPEKTREKIMADYIANIADQKKRITLQNMQMLIAEDLIPLELDFEKRLFNFNKYVKKLKDGDNYKLDSIALRFFRANYNESVLTNITMVGGEETADLKCSIWDNTYQKGMDPVRAWMKKNQEEILTSLNNRLYEKTAEKYTEGNISKWEMDSLGFYYHEHELEKLPKDIYSISDFNELPEQPEVDRKFNAKDGGEITMYKISRICGTVIDKDKNKSSVTLLTPTGVVTVKVWKNQYAAWDRQISERGEDGVKHVVEKSWFQRGTKLIVTGIRREDNFIPKKYKSTEHPLFEKIIEMDEAGFIMESATERVEVA